MTDVVCTHLVRVLGHIPTTTAARKTTVPKTVDAKPGGYVVAGKTLAEITRDLSLSVGLTASLSQRLLSGLRTNHGRRKAPPAIRFCENKGGRGNSRGCRP